MIKSVSREQNFVKKTKCVAILRTIFVDLKTLGTKSRTEKTLKTKNILFFS